MHKVSLFISTNTGVLPEDITAFPVATNVCEGTRIFFPLLPIDFKTISKAVVQELVAIAYSVPTKLANKSSNSLTYLPCIKLPLSKISLKYKSICFLALVEK